MIVFTGASLVILLLIIFEKSLTALTQLIGECFSVSCIRMWNTAKQKDTRSSDLQDDYGFVYSEDVYKELDFQQLFDEYVKIKKER